MQDAKITDCFVAYACTLFVMIAILFCLLVFLKCIAIYDSLTNLKNSATMMPTLSGLQIGILTDEV